MVGGPRVAGARTGVRNRRAGGLAAGLVGLVIAAVVPLVLTSLPAEAAPGPCDPGSNPVVCENSKPGSPRTEWMVDAAYGDIVGFGTESSVQAGDVLPFKVRTPSASWRIEIYRLGWYGGDGARLMADMTPSVPLPQSQPPCLTDSTSGLVDCANWAVSTSWSVPSGAVSGLYVANFIRNDGVFGVNQFPFVVRSDTSTSDLVIQTSDQTWQAYNSFGGNSLYGGTFAGSSDGRAYKVSYNRPYLNSNLTNFQNDELPMLRWVERNGYDVSYLSGVDTSRNPALLLNHKVFISSGHDEYWNAPQRAGVERAKAAGVNLAFFSGNEMFWKTRFEPSIDGSGTSYRTMVCYKETKAGAKIDPSPEWTGTWRDPRLSPPSDGGRPENAVTGTLFRVNGTVRNTITVPAQYASMRLWRNTDIANLQPGQTASLTASSLGHEWDEFADNGFRPPGAVALSQTTVTFTSGEFILKDFGNTYGTGTAQHSLVLHRDQTSGALVFGAGTVQWAWGLDDLHLNPGPATDARMQQATVNLFADMGAQPQTLQAGLVSATLSTDSTGPAATITAPVPGASVPAGSSTVVTGTATDTGGQVAGIEVSVDGGNSWRTAQPGPDGRFTSWSYPWTPTAPGPATVRVRASDDSANIGSITTVSVNVTGRSCPCTLFGEATPSTVDSGDASAYELGVRFQTSITSSVTGVRFYKAAANTGTHTGSLWSASGQRLATGTFSGETASGWQTLTFSNPIPVTAGVTYIASYTTTTGHYSVDLNYFTGNGAGLPPLTAPASTTAAPQAVFNSGSGFPTSSFRDSNYWVDVTIDDAAVDNQPPQVSSTQPADQAVDVPTSTTVTANFSEAVTPGSVQFNLTGPGGGAVPGTVAVAGDNRSASFTPAAALSMSAVHTASVRASDGSGNTMPTAFSWSFTTSGPPPPVTCPCSIFGSATPTVIDAGPDDAVELGVRFLPSVSGTVSGVRFYKSAANTGTHTGSLWTSAGQLLATGTFGAESASGWQTLSFASPVTVTGGVSYVASYQAPGGHYSADQGYFTGGGAGQPPITAPASTSTAGNGLFSYGSGFPDRTFRASNYWVDALFTPGEDNTPPTVIARSPAAGATDVSTVTTVKATFSEPTLPSTVSLQVTGPGSTAVAGDLALAADGRSATFTAYEEFATSTAYTVTVSAADPQGNPMPVPDTWTFTTSAVGTPVVCPCTVFGSKVPTRVDGGDVGTVELGMRFTPSVDATVTGVRFYKAVANTGTHTGSIWSTTGELLATGTFAAESATGWQTLTLPTPLPVQAGVGYVVSYLTTSGHYAADSGYFTSTGAGKPPVTAPASVAGARNGLFRDGGGFPTESFNDTNYWVDVVLSTVLADTTAPTVTARAPAPGATGVNRTGNVTATFSEDVTGVSQTTMTLTASTGAAVTAVVSYNTTTRVATLNPTGTLPASTQFTVNLTSGITDTATNPLAPVTWTFTTAGDTVAPTVTSRTPAVNATGVSRGTNIRVKFSEPVTGVSSTTVTLRNTTTGALVTAVVTLNSTALTATLNPSTNLQANTQFTVQLTSGIRDIAGNPLAPTSWSFTTRA